MSFFRLSKIPAACTAVRSTYVLDPKLTNWGESRSIFEIVTNSHGEGQDRRIGRGAGVRGCGDKRGEERERRKKRDGGRRSRAEDRKHKGGRRRGEERQGR